MHRERTGPLPGGSDRKESACRARDPGFIAGLGSFPREGTGSLLPVFLPGELYRQRSQRPIVHGVTESWERLERERERNSTT